MLIQKITHPREAEANKPRTERQHRQAVNKVENNTALQNRKLLIKLMLDAIKNYEQVLELAGKKTGAKISEANIISYIEECYPELKGKGVAKRQLEKIFADVKKTAILNTAIAVSKPPQLRCSPPSN